MGNLLATSLATPDVTSTVDFKTFVKPKSTQFITYNDDIKSKTLNKRLDVIATNDVIKIDGDYENAIKKIRKISFYLKTIV